MGDNALLLFIGTLGLFVPIRELDSEIGLICVTAAYTFGLGWALWHPKWGSLATGAAIGAAILAHNNLDTKRGLLSKHALDSLGNVAFVVVGGHYDR